MQRGRKMRVAGIEDMLFNKGRPNYPQNVTFIVEVNAIPRV